MLQISVHYTKEWTHPHAHDAPRTNRCRLVCASVHSYHEWWLFRLRFLFRKPEEQEALQDTARLFTDYFGDLDVTASDVAGKPFARVCTWIAQRGGGRVPNRRA